MHKKDMKQSETPLTHKRCLKLRVISIVFRRHSKCPIGIFSSKIFSYKVYVDKYLYVYSSQKCKCKKKFLIFRNTNMCDCGLLHKRLWFMPLTTAIPPDCHHRRTHLALIISIHENMRKKMRQISKYHLILSVPVNYIRSTITLFVLTRKENANWYLHDLHESLYWTQKVQLQ